MAEIPVKKTGSQPWWLWALLLAIIAIALIWWLAGDTTDYAEDETATGDTEIASTDTSDQIAMNDDTGTLTTIAALRTRDNTSSLDGRSANLDGVEVTGVVGDRTFMITDDNGNDLFVVLDQVPTPDQPGVEGRYDINPGQTIDIQGELRMAENGRIDGERIEDMPGDTQVYLWADEATIVERS